MNPNYALMHLMKFPLQRMFQFFVDGSMHSKEAGECGFESREPGCMSAFYNAFNFALENLDQELSLEIIFKIHSLASENVSGDFGVISTGEFRDGPMKPFRVPSERFTASGIISFMNTAAETAIGELSGYSKRGRSLDFNSRDKHTLELVAENAIEPNVYFLPPFERQTDIYARATFLLNQLNSDLAKARAESNNDNIIKAIVHFVRYMELLHPFNDANGRVFVNIVLNFLLIKNNFLPATFYEPNVFDLYSDEELVNVVKDGMSHTLFVIKNPDKPLFNYTAPSKSDECIETIKDTIARGCIDHKMDALVDTHFSELESYFDSAWDKKFNLHRFSATGDVTKFETLPDKECMCMVIAPQSVAPLYKGLAPLHVACKMNHPEIAAALIRINPEAVNQKDYYGNTPLYYAIQSKNLSLVQLLLESGAAELKVKNLKAESPLEWAAQYLGPDAFN